MTETELKPIVESLIYLAEEPITEASLLAIVGTEYKDLLRQVLAQLIVEYQSAEHGIEIKEIASGYKMATKAEHHEWARKYIKHQTPPTRLSLPALETLAVIAYKQPITIPEIQEIRGVNAVGVLKTLIDKNLVTPAGRRNVVGRPILYKTTKEFLLHFGLKNLDELPSLEEFEELAQSALGSPAPDPLVGPPIEELALESPALSDATETVHESQASTTSFENLPSTGAAGLDPPGSAAVPSIEQSHPPEAFSRLQPPSKGDSVEFSSSLVPSDDIARSPEGVDEGALPAQESPSDQNQVDESLSHFARSK